jgi:hypothetical protein
MNLSVFQRLQQNGTISEASLEKIANYESHKIISVNFELKTLMYLGVLLLTTGVSIIIYNNIDSIGHLAIVIFTAAATLACFGYCIKKSPPFTFKKSGSKTSINDYVLLLGSLLLLILVAYLQFQFDLFGNRWGLATFIPMVILFVTAYYFDHLGILSLAIVNFAAWVGITVTPVYFLRNNDFSSNRLIYTGLALGIFLIAVAGVSVVKNIKAHFYFTYKNFGTHILSIASITALIHFTSARLLWLMVLFIITAFQFREAVREKAFYFLVVTTLYFYIGCSYFIISAFLAIAIDEASVYAILFYFIISGLALAFFLVHFNRKFKRNDSLQ